jgi:tetratricopeptide (TPR) repeat protein
MGVLLTAIFLNFSRSGIAIFVGGSVLWVIAVALRKRSTSGLALGISLLLILVSAVLLLGGRTMERFQQWGSGGPGITSDFRWKIFHDTFQLLGHSPWCGIGLGNFKPVFAMFRKESIAELTVLHPESDWLWLWSEAGWPAVIVVLLGAGLVLWRIFPLEEGTNQRYRLAALIASLIFAIHGLVDVSGHRVGTVYTGLLLLGLALHRPLQLKPSRSIKVFFQLMGILLFAIGTAWAVSPRMSSLVPGGAGVSQAKRLATAAYATSDFKKTIEVTTKALEWAPLDWELYFRRALAELAAKKPTLALTDFRRARFLEPVAYELPRDEGSAWLRSQPTLAATAWRDALRKAGRKRAEVFGSMLTAATMNNPEVGKILEEFGLNEPDLALTYLGRLSGPAFSSGILKVLDRDPDLQTLNEPQKFALFDLWAERGDLDELAKRIEQHPAWLPYAWRGMARHNAAKQDFRAAYELTQRFGEGVAMPRISNTDSLPDLEKRYKSNPDNLVTGFALYHADMQSGRFDDALDIARHFSERSTSPAYFHYLEAQAWAAKQNWERAWSAWLGYRAALSKK